MKRISLLIAILISILAKGQVLIDTKIENEFDSMFKIQPMNVQRMSLAKRLNGGFALILKWHEDTLNLNQYRFNSIDTSGVSIGDTLPLKKDLLSCQGIIRNDTLFISTNFGSFETDLGTFTKISKGHLTTALIHWAQAKIYRKYITDEKSSRIYLASTSQIMLSALPEKPGSRIYGRLTMETEPFYENKANECKNG